MSPSKSPESGQVVNQDGGSPNPSLIQPEQAPQESPWAFWRSVLITLAVALGISQFLVEARYIPSGSMLPGLQLQDRLLVEKAELSPALAAALRDRRIPFTPPL